MVIKKLSQIGNPVLRKKAKPVKSFRDKKVQQVIGDLVDTMRDSDLVGMAAPQLGKSLRIFATEIRKTKYRDPSELSRLKIYINPRMVRLSKEKSVRYEGCGSVAHAQLFAPVKRPKIVTIEAYDKTGKGFRVRKDGWLGRVVQHEYDHLEGILFTDKISDWKKILSFEEYKKYKERRMMTKRKNHIAIMKKSWGLLEKIANGEKTVESRWYKFRRPPWGMANPGDVIWFKNSGEPITLKAKITKVLQFSDLNSRKTKEILDKYGRSDLGLDKNLPSDLFGYFRNKNYCIFVFFDQLQEIEPLNIDKSGFGMMSAWLVVDNINKIKVKENSSRN